MAVSKKVLVALSGGVDSSVAVKLLQDEGYFVSGVVMRMSDNHDGTVEAARRSAKSLGIKLYELDLRDEFKEKIINYFVKEYKNARTPIPCVKCNPEIKFRNLLKTADENGFDYIATGHYANIKVENGVYKIYRGESIERDQSYMLYRLKQDVLSRLFLPLSIYEKPKIREIAKDAGLDCFNAPDSQENCFFSDMNYAEYIETNYGISKEGNFISPEGQVCGKHKGIIHYTVGQRKGLGIALGKPAFVTRIDPKSNEIFLGYEKEMVNLVKLNNLSFIYENSFYDGMRVLAKLRSSGKLLPCTVKLDRCKGICTLLLDDYTAKVSSGQGGCLYNGNEILGGGTIL